MDFDPSEIDLVHFQTDDDDTSALAFDKATLSVLENIALEPIALPWAHFQSKCISKRRNQWELKLEISDAVSCVCRLRWSVDLSAARLLIDPMAACVEAPAASPLIDICHSLEIMLHHTARQSDNISLLELLFLQESLEKVSKVSPKPRKLSVSFCKHVLGLVLTTVCHRETGWLKTALQFDAVLPRILSVTCPCVEIVSLALMLLSENYESSFDSLYGRAVVNRCQVIEELLQRSQPPLFTYCSDTHGFNVPSTTLQVFASKSNLEPIEEALLSEISSRLGHCLNDPRHVDFYVIGCAANDDSTLLHEVAHALFRLDSTYRQQCCGAIIDLEQSDRSIMSQCLGKLFYRTSDDFIVFDEIQAYNITGRSLGVSPDKPSLVEFQTSIRHFFVQAVDRRTGAGDTAPAGVAPVREIMERSGWFAK
jgi:hypothetical protein